MALAIGLAPCPSIIASAARLAQVPKETALASLSSVAGTEATEPAGEGTLGMGTVATTPQTVERRLCLQPKASKCVCVGRGRAGRRWGCCWGVETAAVRVRAMSPLLPPPGLRKAWHLFRACGYVLGRV